MKQHNISPADRAEFSRLGIHGVDTVGIHQTVAKLSMLSPQAIHEVEGLVEWVPPRQSWLWPNRAVEIDAIHAPVLMFSRNGYGREAALKAVNQLPDTPSFLAALVWRLNDWVEPVRRAIEGCARRATYEREWADKRYGMTRRVPILARRAVPRPAPVDVLIGHGAADRNSLVRRAAANGLVLHAASLTNIRSLMTLFDREKSPSVRWRMEYLAR